MNMHTVDWMSPILFKQMHRNLMEAKEHQREAASLSAEELLIKCVAAGDSVLDDRGLPPGKSEFFPESCSRMPRAYVTLGTESLTALPFTEIPRLIRFSRPCANQHKSQFLDVYRWCRISHCWSVTIRMMAKQELKGVHSCLSNVLINVNKGTEEDHLLHIGEKSSKRGSN